MKKLKKNQNKSKKKLVLISLLVALFLASSIQVFACPHVDEFGRPYWHEYLGERAIIITRMENHLHRKEARMNEWWDVYRDVIFSEAFEFPILGVDFWGDGDSLSFESVDSVRVYGEEFRLDIGFPSTLASSRAQFGYLVESGQLNQFNYTVTVTNLVNDEDDIRFTNAESYVRVNQLSQVVEETFLVEGNFGFFDFDNWSMTTFPFDAFYDPIQMRVFAANVEGNIVAIDISRDADSMEKIAVTYDNEARAFVFEVDRPGTFILVHDDFEISDLVSVYDISNGVYGNTSSNTQNSNDETKDTDGFNVALVIVPVVVVVVLGGVGVFVLVNKKR